MARSIVAVIVSYIVMFVLVFLGFACAFLIAGSEVAFKPGLYEASLPWVGIGFGIQFIVGVIGGLICAAIARGGKAPLALAIVLLVLGLGLAIPSVMKRQANLALVRTPDTPLLVAVQRAYWPVWVPFTSPFIGAIGVLIGGRLKRKP